MNIVAIFVSPLLEAVSTMIDSENVVNITIGLCNVLISVLSFCAGALLLRGTLNVGKMKNYQPIQLRRVSPKLVIPLVFLAVSANFLAAEANHSIVSLFSPLGTSMVGDMGEESISAVSIVFMFITTAVIPAVVEEIMFRGLILNNLIPYGRGCAIVGSALLFGLMHMNPAQFLYATVSGIVIGYIYVATRSLWVCMVIHFVNNGISVVQSLLYYMPNTALAARLSSLITLFMVGMGIVSAVILLRRRIAKRKSAPEETGSFGVIHEPGLSYEAHPISLKKKLLLFFAPTNAVFIGFSAFSMALTLLMFMLQ